MNAAGTALVAVEETRVRSAYYPTPTATTETIAQSARHELPVRANHPTPTVTIPGPAPHAYRYVCLDCSDTQTQVLGWGTTCWSCNGTRLAPSHTIANTRPGVAVTELLEHWRHLIR